MNRFQPSAPSSRLDPFGQFRPPSFASSMEEPRYGEEPLRETPFPVQEEGLFDVLRVGVGTAGESLISEVTLGFRQPEFITEEEEKQHPIAATAGHIAGGLAGMVVSIYAAGGILRALPVSRAVMGVARRMVQTGGVGAKAFGMGTQLGLTGGLLGFSGEAVRQVKENDPKAFDLASKTLTEGLAWASLGSVSGATMASGRLLQITTGGTALATTGAMMRSARGEEITKEDIAFDFLQGATWSALFPGRKPGLKGYTDAELMAKLEGEMVRVKGLSKAEGLKEYEALLKSFKGSIEPDVRVELKRIFGVFQRAEFETHPAEAMLDPVIKKAFGARKAALTKLQRDNPVFPEAKGRNKKGKPIIKESKEQKELLESFFADLVGKSEAKKMTLEEMDFLIKGFKSYNRFARSDVVDLKGSIKQANIIDTTVTPFTYVLTKLGMLPLIDPMLRAKQLNEWDMKLSNLYVTSLKRVWLDEYKAAGMKKGITNLLWRTNADKDLIRRLHTGDLTGLTEKQLHVVSQSRMVLDYSLRRLQIHQAFNGEKITDSIPNYIRQIHRVGLEKQREGYAYGGPTSMFAPETGKVPTEMFNPVTMKRKMTVGAEELVGNYQTLMMDAIRRTSREFFLENPEKDLNRVMNYYKNAIPATTKEATISWVKHVALGMPNSVDRRVDALAHSVTKPLSWIGERDLVNDHQSLKKIYNHTIKPMEELLGDNFSLKLYRNFSEMANWSMIYGKPTQGLRNFTQVAQMYGMAGEVAVYKGFMYPISKKDFDEIIQDNPLFRLKRQQAFEMTTAKSTGGFLGTLREIAQESMRYSEEQNVLRTAKISYWKVHDFVMNPKNWRHGWADKKRQNGELPPAGESWFASEKEYFRQEISSDIALTQVDYTKLGQAAYLWSSTGKTLGKFTSWPSNYLFAYWREMISRAFSLKPAWSGPGGPTLPASYRLGPLRHLALTSALITGAGAAGWDLTSIGLGVDVSSEGKPGIAGVLNLGPVPSQAPMVVQMLGAVSTLMTSTNSYELGKASKTLKSYTTAYIPLRGMARDIEKSIEAGSAAPFFFKFHPKSRRERWHF